jgi:hypothetical protein
MTPESEHEPAADMFEALIDLLDGVGGWLAPDEAWALHETVREQAAALRRPLIVVEIGSYEGRSTICLAQGLSAAHADGRVHAIDPHWDSLDGFTRNIGRSGLAERIELIRATSWNARARFGGRSVDVLFVDGSHEYRDVLRDLDDWLPAVREHGVVALHDAFLPGVFGALAKRVLRPGGSLRSPRLCRNLILFRNLPSAEWTVADWRSLAAVYVIGGLRLAAAPLERWIPGTVRDRGYRLAHRLVPRHPLDAG